MSLPAKVAQLVPAGAGGDAKAATPALAYKPKRIDFEMLGAFQREIAAGGRLSNDNLARHLGITGEAVRQRLQHPGRRAWIDEQLEAEANAARGRIMSRAVELAMRGSIDHMNFVAKVGGWFAQPEGGPGQAGNSGPTFIFNSLVPRR